MDNKPQIIEISITTLLSMFGALARLLNMKDKTAIRLSSMLSGCFVAAFSGVLAYFVSDYFELGQTVSYIAAGISGWAGPQLLDRFTSLFLAKAGLNPASQDDTGQGAEK